MQRLVVGVLILMVCSTILMAGVLKMEKFDGGYMFTCSDGSYGLIDVFEDGKICAWHNSTGPKCSATWSVDDAVAYVCH